jgi:hypothetical protein
VINIISTFNNVLAYWFSNLQWVQKLPTCSKGCKDTAVNLEFRQDSRSTTVVSPADLTWTGHICFGVWFVRLDTIMHYGGSTLLSRPCFVLNYMHTCFYYWQCQFTSMWENAMSNCSPFALSFDNGLISPQMHTQTLLFSLK